MLLTLSLYKVLCGKYRHGGIKLTNINDDMYWLHRYMEIQTPYDYSHDIDVHM